MEVLKQTNQLFFSWKRILSSQRNPFNKSPEEARHFGSNRGTSFFRDRLPWWSWWNTQPHITFLQPQTRNKLQPLRRSSRASFLTVIYWNYLLLNVFFRTFVYVYSISYIYIRIIVSLHNHIKSIIEDYSRKMPLFRK